jgi:GTP-dependent phosphoenolpyruvate carboxykinase
MSEEQSTVIDAKRRSFGGKTKDFKDKEERNREKKHLKAYLKGHKFYFHGFVTTPRGRERAMYKVHENWT